MYMIAEVSQYVAVASFAEAWIEIPSMALSEKQKFVASFAEAWIEMNKGPEEWWTPRRLLRGGVD